MTVHGGGVRTKRRRYAIFFIWVILIFSQFSLFSAEKSLSTPRKARIFGTASVHGLASSPDKLDEDPDMLYGEEKRLVHTGPNPLHN